MQVHTYSQQYLNLAVCTTERGVWLLGKGRECEEQNATHYLLGSIEILNFCDVKGLSSEKAHNLYRQQNLLLKKIMIQCTQPPHLGVLPSILASLAPCKE